MNQAHFICCESPTYWVQLDHLKGLLFRKHKDPAGKVKDSNGDVHAIGKVLLLAGLGPVGVPIQTGLSGTTPVSHPIPLSHGLPQWSWFWNENTGSPFKAGFKLNSDTDFSPESWGALFWLLCNF